MKMRLFAGFLTGATASALYMLVSGASTSIIPIAIWCGGWMVLVSILVIKVDGLGKPRAR